MSCVILAEKNDCSEMGKNEFQTVTKYIYFSVLSLQNTFFTDSTTIPYIMLNNIFGKRDVSYPLNADTFRVRVEKHSKMELCQHISNNMLVDPPFDSTASHDSVSENEIHKSCYIVKYIT